MFAGAQFEFRSPLRVGDSLERRSTVADITIKQGRSGELAFVKIRHELRRVGEAEPVLVEVDDIVYREAKKPGDADPPPQPAPTGATWRRELTPDEVLLFRYSALTLNGHRIHYDWPYATGVEGYPGLVVHGPLIATLLLDLVRREAPLADLAAFRFRAVRPAICGRRLRLSGAPQDDGRAIRLWAEDHEGWLTMDALATLR
jgi:3-methylfumaryl-CoA hydratase